MHLWQNYVTDKNNTYGVLYVNCPMMHWNKIFICSWDFLDAQFG